MTMITQTTERVLTPELEVHAQRIREIRKRSSIEIGRELFEARKKCKHGTWGDFLKSIDMTETTSRNYINVYKKFGHEAPEIIEAVTALAPKLQYQLAAPSAPTIEDTTSLRTIARDLQKRADRPSLVKADYAYEALTVYQLSDLALLLGEISTLFQQVAAGVSPNHPERARLDRLQQRSTEFMKLIQQMLNQ